MMIARFYGRSMTTYPVNNVELDAETYGDPADPAVLLIHGAGRIHALVGLAAVRRTGRRAAAS